MGSTSVGAQSAFIEVLNAQSIGYVLLHGADLFAAGLLSSDLDLAIRRPPREIVELVRPLLARRGIELLFLWHSDVGTLNTFWWEMSAGGGIQVDLLFDPEGGNRFGFMTSGIWDAVDASGEICVLEPDIENLYLLAKRLGKGQYESYRSLRNETPLTSNIDHVLARRTRLMLWFAAKKPCVRFYGEFTKLRSRIKRINFRLCNRQGFVVSLRGENGAVDEFVRELEKVLPRVLFVGKPKVRNYVASRLTPTVVVVPICVRCDEPLAVQLLTEIGPWLTGYLSRSML